MIPTWGTSTGRNSAGGIPSLLLDFSNQSYLLNGTAFAAFGESPGITFSRGTNATLIDSTGTLTYAPNNQLLNSESFGASNWGRTNIFAVSSNASVAPNGTTTADKVIPTTTNADHSIGAGIGTVQSGNIYNLSVYAKANGYNFIRLSFGSGAGGGYTFFDVLNGNIGGTSGMLNNTIENVGNGWFRCSVKRAAGSTAGLSGDLYVQSANNQFGWAGNETDGVLFWGAQLEAVTYETAPRAYNSTTPKNLLGFTEEFDNAAWVKTLATVTANSIADPNGNLNADTLSATLGNATILQNISLLAAPYTFSIWLKRKTGTGNINITINGVTFVTQAVTADWARFSTTLTPSAGTKNIGVQIVTLGDEVYAWGAQVSDSASLDPYAYNPAAAPTSTAYYGPRFEYDPNVAYSTDNLLEFPTEFSNAAWQKSNLIIPIDENTAVDPTGYMGAEKLIPITSVNTSHSVLQAQATTIGTTLTGSVYVKAAGYNFAAVLLLTTFAAAQIFIVDLTDGSVGSTTGSPIATSVTNAGNGWWRISITQITNATGSAVFQVRPAEIGTSTNFVGDGTSGIYAWGAQLVTGAAPVPFYYYPYTPLGLLIEEARTNLMFPSNATTGWTPSSGLVVATANAATSPDGTTNATKLATNDTASGFHIWYKTYSGAVNTAYCASVYLKAGEYTRAQIAFDNSSFAIITGALFDLANGTVVATNGGSTATITPVGNGWYRCSVTATSDADGGNYVVSLNPVPSSVTTFNSVYTPASTGLGVYVYGVQVEAGGFATSFVPTVSASVTRSADVATMVGNNFTNWYNQTTGTLAVTFDASANSDATYVSASNGTITQNSAHIDNDAGTSTMRAVYYSGGTAVATLGLGAISTVGATNRIATAYAVNDFAASRNGGAIATDTLGAVPVGLTQLNIGTDDRLVAANYTSNHIKTISYFNSRLPNSSLQAITA